ncbi:MAG: hypothetical protein AAGG07_07635 [Planctomycetota bacterium]
MKKTVILAAAAMCAGSAAAESVMTFESLSSSISSRQNLGSLYTEAGFQLFAEPASNFATAGANDAVFYAGSSALHNAFLSGDTRLTRVGGGAFSFLSIKLSMLSSLATGTAPVTFEGTTSGGQTLTHTVVVDHFGFVEYTLPATWTDLTQVRWEQQSAFHQFDDVRVSPLTDPIIPAPHAAAMGVLGLGGLAARRRR